MSETGLKHLQNQVEAVRRFNRFYTLELGLLRRTFLSSPWSLGEVRVLFEVFISPGLTAKDICARLNLDPAHVSRLLSRFEAKGMIARNTSEEDARQLKLTLTAQGQADLEAMNALQRSNVTSVLESMAVDERDQLVSAMETIERLMTERET